MGAAGEGDVQTFSRKLTEIEIVQQFFMIFEKIFEKSIELLENKTENIENLKIILVNGFGGAAPRRWQNFQICA